MLWNGETGPTRRPWGTAATLLARSTRWLCLHPSSIPRPGNNAPAGEYSSRLKKRLLNASHSVGTSSQTPQGTWQGLSASTLQATQMPTWARGSSHPKLRFQGWWWWGSHKQIPSPPWKKCSPGCCAEGRFC